MSLCTNVLTSPHSKSLCCKKINTKFLILISPPSQYTRSLLPFPTLVGLEKVEREHWPCQWLQCRNGSFQESLRTRVPWKHFSGDVKSDFHLEWVSWDPDSRERQNLESLSVHCLTSPSQPSWRVHGKLESWCVRDDIWTSKSSGGWSRTVSWSDLRGESQNYFQTSPKPNKTHTDQIVELIKVSP